MSSLLNNPAHWRLRALETRLMADQLTDLAAKATILRIADYEQLAARADSGIQEKDDLKRAG
jgi:hypothetical protein